MTAQIIQFNDYRPYRPPVIRSAAPPPRSLPKKLEGDELLDAMADAEFLSFWEHEGQMLGRWMPEHWGGFGCDFDPDDYAFFLSDDGVLWKSLPWWMTREFRLKK